MFLIWFDLYQLNYRCLEQVREALDRQKYNQVYAADEHKDEVLAREAVGDYHW